MKREINLFGQGNTPFLQKNENINQNQNFNLFDNINSQNNQQFPLFDNQNKINFQNDYKKKGEGNKIELSNSHNKKKDLNPKTFVKKSNNYLKNSININLLPDDNFKIEANTKLDNNKNINNNIKINININNNNKRTNSYIKKNNNINNKNMNPNTNLNKNQINNNYNIDYNNINNKDNDNNNNEIKDNNPKIKERNNNEFKSMILFNEQKKEKKEMKNNIKKKEEISIKKKLENEKNKAEIIDKLKCYICMEKIKKPRMCKFCQRAACENCLKNWLQTKNQCGFCRTKIKFSDTIEMPIINDIADFFLKNITNQKQPVVIKDNNKNNFISEIHDSFKEEIPFKLEEGNICPKHKNNYEYYCYQCNQKYCDKCLVFFNDSAKIHENHMIISLDEKEKNKNKINETMEEFQKLNKTNSDLDNLINLCELKLRELEIEKNNFIEEIDFIKDEISTKYDDFNYNLKSKEELAKTKESEFANSIDTTPNAIQNIIKLQDYGQGKQIYEHLSNLNKYALDNNDILNLPQEYLFIETFTSEQIELFLPNINNNKPIINEQTFNFIPNYIMKLTFENMFENIFIKINLRKEFGNNLDFEKILCFIILRNKKYGCEFIKMKADLSELNEIRLYSTIGKNIFFSFKDENDKIIYKLYFMIYKP